MKPIRHALICLSVLLFAPIVSAEQLVVFVQSASETEIATSFEKEHLPKIASLAEQMGLELIVKDVSTEGAPEEVGITPLIVFQNHAGRSIYQGRYTTTDRVANFVTTARFMPQGSTKRVMKDVAYTPLGRSKTVYPIKITDVAGHVPDDFDQAAFKTEFRKWFNDSDYDTILHADQLELGRSDRLFYLDFYPYRSEDGKLYVSVAIFSQFHCHEPVFTQMENPITVSWDKPYAAAFEAVRIVDEQIEKQIKASAIGDGFDPVATQTPVVSWEDLSLQLPPKPEGAIAIDPADVELAQAWAVDTDAQQTRPAVTFAFPAPLDGYAGRSTGLTGELTLGDNLGFAGAEGKFVVSAKDVTMGEPDLDNYVRDDLLASAKHPDSDFTFTAIETDVEQLAFGQVIPAKLVGKFTMKGITIPLAVPVSMEAYVAPDGSPRVSIDGSWAVNLLDPFEIVGPDGPEDIRNNLQYRCYIVLKPAK